MNKETINQRFTNAVDFLISTGNGLKKGDISDFLNIKPSTFSEILKNRSNVSAETIANFSERYHINPEWLLTGKGEMLRGGESPPAPPAPPKEGDVGAGEDACQKQIRLLEENIKDLRKNVSVLEENSQLKSGEIKRLELEVEGLKKELRVAQETIRVKSELVK